MESITPTPNTVDSPNTNLIPEMRKTKKTKKLSRYFPVILLSILILTAVSATVYLLTLRPDNRLAEVTPETTPAPTKMIKVLPPGPQTYMFSHGTKVRGPKPSEATIDPLDPKPNQSQSLTVKISHTQEVTSATVTLITDNGQKILPLTLISGTKQDGTWKTEWTMTDTFNHQYQLDFNLTDGKDTYTGGLAFR